MLHSFVCIEAVFLLSQNKNCLVIMEFGELNIAPSRAFWDDYENIDGDQPIESIE